MSSAETLNRPPGKSPEPIWQLIQFKKMKAFNDANESKTKSLECWPVIELPPSEDPGYHVWVVVLAINVDARFPMAKKKCRLRIEGQPWWEATRILNPTDTISIPSSGSSTYSTYKVKVPRAMNDDRQPLFAPLEMTTDPRDRSLRPNFSADKMHWASLSLEFKSVPQLDDLIQNKGVPDAAWKFPDPKNYHDIFRWGTEEDFEFEAAGIRNFNRESVYKCWLIVQDTSDHDLPRDGSKGATRQQCLVVLEVQETPEFPRVGDLCELAFENHIPALMKYAETTKDNKRLKRRGPKYLSGARRDNPYDKVDLDERSGAGSNWNNYCTFKVAVYKESADDYSPFNGFDFKLNWRTISRSEGRQRPRILLDRASAFEAHLFLGVSTTTKSVELDALAKAMRQPVASPIGKAFSYIRTFESSTETFDLFEALPHMNSDRKLPDNLSALFQRLDKDQMQAYRNLSHLPARVGILLAGSGMGKTTLFLTISALALSLIEET